MHGVLFHLDTTLYQCTPIKAGTRVIPLSFQRVHRAILSWHRMISYSCHDRTDDIVLLSWQNRWHSTLVMTGPHVIPLSAFPCSNQHLAVVIKFSLCWPPPSPRGDQPSAVAISIWWQIVDLLNYTPLPLGTTVMSCTKASRHRAAAAIKIIISCAFFFVWGWGVLMKSTSRDTLVSYWKKERKHSQLPIENMSVCAVKY